MKKTISILGKKYTVEYVPNSKLIDCMGISNRHSQEILIDESTAEDQKAETLIHEVIHVIEEELLLGLPEETVARLAVGLYSAGMRLK